MPAETEQPPHSARPEASGPSRAQRRLLGLTGPRRPYSDDENETLEQVVVAPAAWSTFRALLDSPGRLCGGTLYGHRQDGVLHVRLAAPGGYACWLPETDPLAHDPRYVLGWSDCLTRLYGDATDWVGQWLMYPDRLFPAVSTDHEWMLRGVHDRLIDHEHPLLVIGYSEGVARIRAARFEFGSADITPMRILRAWEDRLLDEKRLE